MLSGHQADLVGYLQAAPAAQPPPPPAPARPWSAADWRLFHNDRQLVAEVARGQTRGQARTYAYVCCIREWCRVRPGSSEDQAIIALAMLGITDPSPPPPPARHKAAIVEHLQATGPEIIGLAAGDITGSVPIIAGAGISASTGITRSAADDTDSSASGDITSAVSGSAGSAGSTALLRPTRPWGQEDWQAHYDERAAIVEYDGKLSRPEAEKQALAHCLSKWLYENPMSSNADDGCLVCNEPDRPGDPLPAPWRAANATRRNRSPRSPPPAFRAGLRPHRSLPSP